MDKRLEKIENYIRQYHMIEKGDRIVIGVSGGADSVCLLMALCSLQEKLGFQVDVYKRQDEGERSIFERGLRIKKIRKPRKMWIYLDKQQGNRYNST